MTENCFIDLMLKWKIAYVTDCQAYGNKVPISTDCLGDQGEQGQHFFFVYPESGDPIIFVKVPPHF